MLPCLSDDDVQMGNVCRFQLLQQQIPDVSVSELAEILGHHGVSPHFNCTGGMLLTRSWLDYWKISGYG